GATITAGTNGTRYPSIQLAASGGESPYIWELAENSRLPMGMILTRDGVLYGTPQQTGSFSIVIRVRDGAVLSNEALQTFSMTVNPPATGFQVTTTSLPNGIVGTPYDQPLTTTGGTPVLWIGDTKALNALGLQLNS